MAADSELLQRFLLAHDEAAFETLVARHGPMVLGVCRRRLHDRHVADDAYQATFLVLARNAAAVRRPDSLASWLHGVAYRVATRLRRVAQRSKEQPSSAALDVAQSHADPVAQVIWRELRPMLDEELNRLPEKYRAPLVLCELEGKSNADAARELGCPASSLSSRLARARELLRVRLASRGVALSSGLLFAAFPEQATATAPDGLVRATVRAAVLLHMGQAATGDGVSAGAVLLAEGVGHAILMAQLRTVAVVLLLVGLLGTAAGMGLHQAISQPLRPPAEQRAERGPAADEKEAEPPAPVADPVEELRDTLRIPVRDTNNRDEIQFRKAGLEKRINNLLASRQRLGLGTLRQALMLQEWRDEDRDQNVAAVDSASRKELCHRFLGSVREELTNGSPDGRLAAAALVGEMGTSVREMEGRGGLARVLGPDLVKLLASRDGRLRQTAAWALGKINPDPEVAGPALGKLLTQLDANDRRAAIEGVVNLLRTLLNLTKGRNSVIEITQAQVAALAHAAITALGHGLRDPDAEVRRLCLEAVKLGSTVLTEQVADPAANQVFPPPGRKPTRDELAEIEAYRASAEQERESTLPLARALGSHAAGVVAILKKEDARGIAASATLEELATARGKLVRKAESVPRLDKEDTGLREDPLHAGLRAAVPILAKKTAHPELRLRLAALYALETLEAEAVPAVDALVKALDDSAPFVRWAAVRALAKMAPRAAAKVVAGLAKRLDDSNADVRITTAAALERYGPAATPAVEALAKAVGHRSVEFRTWVLKALAATGPDAKAAVPTLTTALTAPEPEVRAGAARALGKIGPAAKPAEEALRKALEDPDDEVRQAAADALLVIGK